MPSRRQTQGREIFPDFRGIDLLFEHQISDFPALLCTEAVEQILHLLKVGLFVPQRLDAHNVLEQKISPTQLHSRNIMKLHSINKHKSKKVSPRFAKIACIMVV